MRYLIKMFLSNIIYLIPVDTHWTMFYFNVFLLLRLCHGELEQYLSFGIFY